MSEKTQHPGTLVLDQDFMVGNPERSAPRMEVAYRRIGGADVRGKFVICDPAYRRPTADGSRTNLETIRQAALRDRAIR